MDSVRLGRVLGAGARGAAKTLLLAVDAASTPDPRPPAAIPSRATAIQPTAPLTPAAGKSTPTATPAPQPRSASPARDPISPRSTSSSPRSSSAKTARPTAAGLAEGSRRFGQASWAPVARLSGVLWLEFTGVFFGVFALTAGTAGWRLRDAFHTTSPGDPARTHLLLACAVTAVFTWFCISSFVRARRRGRRA